MKKEDFIEIIKSMLIILKKDCDRTAHQILSFTVRQIETIADVYASKAAEDRRKKENIEKKLIEYNYSQQVNKSGMNDKNRKIFHFEHYYPVSDMVNELLSLEDITNENIDSVIKKTRICWILKSENRKLEKKYKKNRIDPEKAYKEFGIILDEDYKQGFLNIDKNPQK